MSRFKLWNCGMSLLQGDVLPKSLAKHVLRFKVAFEQNQGRSFCNFFISRQRIYSCSLDFFCADKMYPVRWDQFVSVQQTFETSTQRWP